MTHDERRLRRKAIADAVTGGMSVSETTVKYGVSRKSVYTACSGNGVRISTNRMIAYFTLAALLNTDDSCAAIAVRLGVSKPAVYQVLEKARGAGIKFPHREGRGP